MHSDEQRSLQNDANNLEITCKEAYIKYANQETAFKLEEQRHKRTMTYLGSFSLIGACIGALSPYHKSYPRAHRVLFGLIGVSSALFTLLVPSQEYSKRALEARDISNTFGNLEKGVRVFKDLHLQKDFDVNYAKKQITEFAQQRNDLDTKLKDIHQQWEKDLGLIKYL